jgi:hypothetical protein
MNYCWHWLIAYAWRNRLIDRKEFIDSWAAVQALGEMHPIKKQKESEK